MPRLGVAPARGGRLSRGKEEGLSEALPESIGRYRVVRELGRGMMGVVYEAEDPLLGRRVALKTIHRALSDDPQTGEVFEKRFFAEARAAAGLSHPGIVVVHDVGRDDAGRLFIALEHLEGRTLDEVLAGGRSLTLAEATHVAVGLAEALHHAHSRGIIHRDIKPGNVMLLESGEPKILDFGIARLPASELTAGNAAFGSPSYMAPERIDGLTPDARADVFSLGAVFYEMLTGRRCFGGKDLVTIVRKVYHEDPVPPSELQSRLPASMDAIVARALAKDPAHRYPTARAFADDLRAAAAGRPMAGEPVKGGTPAKLGRSEPRRPEPPLLDLADGTIRAGAIPGLALPAGKRVSLAILEGSRQGERFVLARPRSVLGREGGGMNADVEVADPETSRAHAAVECYGTRIVLRDLESTNGTWVGERRVKEVELENHGEFRLGRTRFMLIVTDPE